MNFNRSTCRSRGFTLIELLTVIAIIGVLASLIGVRLNITRNKAHDARRIAEMDSMMTALELYYDENGVYPCGVLQAGGGATQVDDDIWHDDTTTGSFLNADDPFPADGFTCSTTPTYGLVDEGILPGGVHAGGGRAYRYEVLDADRSLYILYVTLDYYTERMENDGGFDDCHYEVGPGLGIMDPDPNCP